MPERGPKFSISTQTKLKAALCLGAGYLTSSCAAPVKNPDITQAQLGFSPGLATEQAENHMQATATCQAEERQLQETRTAILSDPGPQVASSDCAEIQSGDTAIGLFEEHFPKEGVIYVCNNPGETTAQKQIRSCTLYPSTNLPASILSGHYMCSPKEPSIRSFQPGNPYQQPSIPVRR